MMTAQSSARCALLAAAGWLCAPALAATATAQASATVVVPAPVNDWLGVPVSVQDLLLAQNAPAGPATGNLVPHVPGATIPAILRLPPAWIASAVDSRQGFGIDFAAGAALLPRGPAAAVSVAAAGTGGDGDAPLVITVAFN